MERLGRIEGILGVIQAQIAAQKYSTLPRTELRNHREELKGIKDNLAAAKKDTPGFWPASFQIITLLSQATSDVGVPQKETILSDVSGPPNSFLIENTNVLLKNLVAGATIKNSIVRFDASVRLANDTFINCVFIFPVYLQNPSEPLRKVAETLLASDLANATIKAS